jgi:signal transduction histidine kinase
MTSRRSSIESKATAGLIAIGALFLFAQLAIFIGAYMDNRIRLGLERLGREADVIASRVVRTDEGLRLIIPSELVARSPLPELRAEVFLPDGSLIGRIGESFGGMSPPRADFSLAILPGPKGDELVLSAKTSVEGEEVFVRVFSGSRGIDGSRWDALFEFASKTWLQIVGMLVLIPLLNVAMVRQSLRPLQAAAERIRALDSVGVSGGDSLQLDASGDLPEEVAVLVGAVESSFSRMRAALRAQRSFVADAAHEMRTPMAVLTLGLGALEKSQEVDRLRKDAAAMAFVVERLLQAAQADALIVDASAVSDISEVAEDVVASLAPMAIRVGKSAELDSAGIVMVAGERGFLWQAVRNLVENAIRHSPVGGRVIVSVRVDEAVGVVEVRDFGQGVPEGREEDVFKRFWRADRSSMDGVGLGLSIVSRIAEAHGGVVSAGRPNDGGPGASFRLSIPLSASVS